MPRHLLPGVLAMAAIVVASNILVQFLFGNWLTWGAFTYPFAFLVTDLTNRLYGPAAARRARRPRRNRAPSASERRTRPQLRPRPP